MSKLRRLLLHTLVLTCVALLGCGDQTNLSEPDGGEAAVEIAALSSRVAAVAGRLDDGEKAHLIFMRSEEKLARDVYLTLAGMYDAPVFSNIASTAEQTHTDKMLDMLEKFNVPDPEPHTLRVDEFPPPDDQIGVFESVLLKVYFEGKFDYLTEKAALSLLDALKVGALIEELDMNDINYCNAVIYDVFEPPPSPDCGLTFTDVKALENTLGNLLAGSKNHLCAFIGQIGPMSDGCYEAQYLGQGEVRNIINAQCPEFISYVCP